MPTTTYTPLATKTLTGNQSSLTFSNIPGTYRDLILIAVPYGNQTNDSSVAFNGSTANFSGVRMYGGSGGAISNSYSDSGGMMLVSDNLNLNVIWQIMDYSATDKHKTVLVRTNRPSDSFAMASAHRWANTAAITSITLTPVAPYVYTSGARFDLYGVIA